MFAVPISFSKFVYESIVIRTPITSLTTHKKFGMVGDCAEITWAYLRPICLGNNKAWVVVGKAFEGLLGATGMSNVRS